VGTVFKKTFTKPAPADAETIVRKGERLARWRDRKGKLRSARLTVGQDGSERVAVESPYYFAKYRDGAGRVRVVATGCRDETAARQVLADLERKAQLIRSGILTTGEAAMEWHIGKPLADHFAAYDEHLQAKGTTRIHRGDTGRCLRRLAVARSFGTLADLGRDRLERWLAERTAENMSARTRNAHRNALGAFCNWCVATDRLNVNPFGGVSKANERADPRRQRRAMDETELVQLLGVARQRPLIEATTVRKGPRKGERYADVRPEVRERLETLGWERSLIYKTLVLTGLRKGELRSLTAGQLDLDGPTPCAMLDAADEKNRQGSAIVLRDDLAADLRDGWASSWNAYRAKLGVLPGRSLPVCPARRRFSTYPTGCIASLTAT
jgi:integrase